MLRCDVRFPARERLLVNTSAAKKYGTSAKKNARARTAQASNLSWEREITRGRLQQPSWPLSLLSPPSRPCGAFSSSEVSPALLR